MPVTTDASIRGIQSIIFTSTGQRDYKYVRRCNLESKSPAKKFEDRFVRYLERKLKKNIYSMFGDNVNYWRFATPAGNVDFIICANNFNLKPPLKTNNTWLLRVREEEPYTFINWIAEHFPQDSAVTRKLNNGYVQVQFPSSALTSDNDFFKTDIPALTDDDFEDDMLIAYRRKKTEADSKLQTINPTTKIH